MVVNNTKPYNREHAERVLCWSFDSIALQSYMSGFFKTFNAKTKMTIPWREPLMCQNNSKLDIDIKTTYGVI